MRGNLSAKAIGLGRFFTFTPGTGQIALPSVDQTGTESGLVLTAGLFIRILEKYYFHLDYSGDSGTFKESKTTLFGLDYSSDPAAVLAGVILPGLYTSNPMLARSPAKVRYSSLTAGFSMRIDFAR
jgi:hypothetical protein